MIHVHVQVVVNYYYQEIYEARKRLCASKGADDWSILDRVP